MKTNLPAVHATAQPQIVKIRKNQVVTTSLLVANKFGKRHSDIVRAIKRLVLANAKLRSLYKSGIYRDEQGKTRPMYYFTRDGFVLLVMGFTGKDALDFKLDYINAFNTMEQKLKEPLQLQPLLEEQKKLTEHWLKKFHLHRDMAIDALKSSIMWIETSTKESAKNTQLIKENATLSRQLDMQSGAEINEQNRTIDRLFTIIETQQRMMEKQQYSIADYSRLYVEQIKINAGLAT